MMTTDRITAPVAIGGGGHTRSLVAMAPAALRPTAYVDPVDSLPLIWLGDDETFLADDRYAALPVIISFVSDASCTMGLRRLIIAKYARRNFATIIADDALVEPDVLIGEGTAVFHRAVVNTGTFLGPHTVVNTGAIVEHDVTVGENTFIGPGAIVCGGARIGRDVYIGAGACVRNGISVVDGVTIGAGTVVINDLLHPGVYVGNPARFIHGI